MTTSYDPLPGPLVSADWLRDNLDTVGVVDVRWSIPTGPMRDRYEEGHIPGAVFADLDTDLSAPAGPRGRHPLPTPQDFAVVRSRLGLTRPVVAYDGRGGAVAARLWWMLDSIGVPCAVLEGGLEAWGEPLDSGSVSPVHVPAGPIPWPADRFIDADDMVPAIADGAVALDARNAERFRGEPNDIDPRLGHVPGATSWPWESNLDADARFMTSETLRSRFAELGVVDGSNLIASCGSGVTGCHVLLAARVAGIDGGRLYAGSWSEWAADPDRPVETSPPG
ncbi:MAG: sulfurtransferase [Acidimicrobiales bacterium]